MKNDALVIKDLVIEHPFISAPLAGVSGHPYRKMVKKFGASLVFSEMISSKALTMNSAKTLDLARFGPGERPFAAQLFGDNPEVMSKAAKIIESLGVDIIDINMGCPVPKVLKSGGGAKLLQNFELASDIVSAVSSSVSIPVTVKTRIGWSNDEAGLELGFQLEKAGAAAITYHARTCRQKYSGVADWQKLKKAKSLLGIPVIGSGDIFSAQNAIDMLTRTSVDGVMIARGAFGYPWIFKEALSLWRFGKTDAAPDKREKIKESILLFTDMIDFYGEQTGISMGRKHLLWFLKGQPESHKIKEEIMRTRDKDHIISLLENFSQT